MQCSIHADAVPDMPLHVQHTQNSRCYCVIRIVLSLSFLKKKTHAWYNHIIDVASNSLHLHLFTIHQVLCWGIQWKNSPFIMTERMNKVCAEKCTYIVDAQTFNFNYTLDICKMQWEEELSWAPCFVVFFHALTCTHTHIPHILYNYHNFLHLMPQ